MNAAQAARHADLERLAQFGDFIGRWNERRARERAALQGAGEGSSPATSSAPRKGRASK